MKYASKCAASLYDVVRLCKEDCTCDTAAQHPSAARDTADADCTCDTAAQHPSTACDTADADCTCDTAAQHPLATCDTADADCTCDRAVQGSSVQKPTSRAAVLAALKPKP